MGLDQYLYVSTTVFGGKYSTPEENERFNTAMTATGLKEEDFSALLTSSPSVQLNFKVAYWRKANQIHKWFVDKCQDGKDECQLAYVEQGQLEELLALCKKLLRSKSVQKAKEELPTADGCFFGDTDYGEWYWEDLKETVRQLSPLLKNPKFEDWHFYYKSSW